MVSLTALEPPLRIAVRVSGNNATDRVMAVAALTVIERVAPFARVAAWGELLTADAVVEAAPLAFGLLADQGGVSTIFGIVFQDLEAIKW